MVTNSPGDISSDIKPQLFEAVKEMQELHSASQRISLGLEASNE